MIAPIHYTGDVTYEHRIENVAEGHDRERKLAMLNLDAGSYIWQPWFLTANAGIGLAYNTVDTETAGDTTGEIITGNTNFMFLPMSRFPLELHLERQDSRVTGETAGNIPFTNTRYGLIQSYRNRDGSVNLRFTYDEGKQEMAGQDDDTS
ncbi:MAG: hypothetical protein OEY89_17805, partial [Gammaproteobacteria bacterium]|nr:hypothetical protein [Gammaproteobacteria bacterium]